MKPLIVYVDDVKGNIDWFKMVAGGKYLVEAFSDPKAALERISDLNPAAVVSDQKMQYNELPGTVFLQEVAKLVPEAKRILITGYSEEQVVIESIKLAKVHDYIKRPCKNEHILEVLDRVLIAHEEDRQTKISNLDTAAEYEHLKQGFNQMHSRVKERDEKIRQLENQLNAKKNKGGRDEG